MNPVCVGQMQQLLSCSSQQMCMRARFLAGRDMSVGKTEQLINSSWKTPSGDRDVVLNIVMHTASSVSQPTAADASNSEGPYCGTGTDCTAQWRACSLASCALRSESGPKFDPCFTNGCAELVSSVWHRNGAIFLISQTYSRNSPAAQG